MEYEDTKDKNEDYIEEYQDKTDCIERKNYESEYQDEYSNDEEDIDED